MDLFFIRNSIDNLVFQKDEDVFGYRQLLTHCEGKEFLATQVALSHCYKYEFNAQLATKARLFGNSAFYEFRAILEQKFQKFIHEKLLIGEKTWDTSKPSAHYVDFLKQLICEHSSYHHQFFIDFIAREASKEDIRFYLAQESSPRFDDLLAMIQVGSPIQMKMELAKNYWDEMGNGNFSKVHASMFSKVLRYFNVTEQYTLDKVLATSLVSDNLSAMLAMYREHFAHAIGFLAVTEFCVPLRFKYLIEGCRRLSVDEEVLKYHILHTDIDGEHAEGWLREIIVPMIEANPLIAEKITEGALLKLNSSQCFFDGILDKLCYGASQSNQWCDNYA